MQSAHDNTSADNALQRERAATLAVYSQLPFVAESGVGNGEDARRVAAAGYELALVGSALMSAPSPHALAAEMLKGGRQGHDEYKTQPRAEAFVARGM